MIGVVDYGIGNVRSICAALARLQVPHILTGDPSALRNTKGLILPGVGAFADAMESLRSRNLVEVLNDLVVGKGRPILGICVGLQVMAQEGNEFGRSDGLGWLRAKMTKLQPSDETFLIPHVGWNECTRVRDSALFRGIPTGGLFYFTHSYRLECDDPQDVTAMSDHGGEFVAAIERANIYGTQFHPEKSQQLGLKVFENFSREIVGLC